MRRILSFKLNRKVVSFFVWAYRRLESISAVSIGFGYFGSLCISVGIPGNPESRNI